MSLTSSSPDSPYGLCLPRFGTARNYGRETYGPDIQHVMSLLGTPPMGWQRLVTDVLGEIDPRTGRLFYSEGNILVPRQSGKTTIILGAAIHRCLVMSRIIGKRQNVIYTAQTRGAARKKLVDDHVPVLRDSSFGRFIPANGVRLANDSESVTFENGSRYGIEASTKTAGHGQVIDLAFADEAFSDEDSRREGALRPAMSTRQSPQWWVVSTMGDETSTYLNEKVAAGRQGVNDPTRRIAYFEWSAGDDVDPADAAARYGYMPALGSTVTQDFIESTWQSMRTDNEDEYRRAFMNQLRSRGASVQVIPAEVWKRAADPLSRPTADAPRVIAIDAAPDGSSASIAVAGWRQDGLLSLDVVDSRPGTAWVAERVSGMVHGPRRVVQPVTLAGRAAGALADDLAYLKVTSKEMSQADMQRACAQFVAGVGEFRHTDSQELSAAIANASQRFTGDGWTWDKKASQVPIDSLVALTAARWAIVRPDADLGPVDVDAELPDWRSAVVDDDEEFLI